MDKKFKLAVVGNESAVLIFRALGVEVFNVITTEEVRILLENLVLEHHGDEHKTPKYAIIFVEEAYYKVLAPEFLEKMTKKSLPAIVPIPSPGSQDKDFAVKRLSRIVEKAIGSDILS